jgi:HPt (histidine-containing phosphotransfer) domain-containing protein
MSQRLSDYFAVEAAEYLVRLARLLAQPEGPELAELVRLARAIRGGAQLAELDPIARVAERLETAGRRAISGDLAWTEAMRALSLLTVADLQQLVDTLGRWGPEEADRATRAVRRWDEPLSAAAAPAPPVADEPIPISALFHDDDGPHLLFAPSRPAPPEAAAGGERPTGTGTGMDVVPIERLLLRGAAALEEALALRSGLEQALRAAGAADPAVVALLEEVFDLVRLGLDDEA